MSGHRRRLRAPVGRQPPPRAQCRRPEEGRSWASAGSVGDELHQRPVGVAEVDARALPERAVALDRTELDRDLMLVQVLDGALDRAVPAETDVAVARAHAVPRDWVRVDAGAVDIELLVVEGAVRESLGAVAGPEPVREAGPAGDDLGADDVRVEPVRALPVGDRDHE